MRPKHDSSCAYECHDDVPLWRIKLVEGYLQLKSSVGVPFPVGISHIKEPGPADVNPAGQGAHETSPELASVVAFVPGGHMKQLDALVLPMPPVVDPASQNGWQGRMKAGRQSVGSHLRVGTFMSQE
jgi:hypothetical protein